VKVNMKRLKKAGVQRYTPAAQVLREILSTGLCSEMAALRTMLKGDRYPAPPFIDQALSRAESLCELVYLEKLDFQRFCSPDLKSNVKFEL